MKKLPLTQNESVVLDDDTYEWLSDYYWCVTRGGKNRPYAIRAVTVKARRFKLYMHRLICGFPANFAVAFENGNSLDCRMDNLKVINLSGQEEPWRGGHGVSAFNGVSWHEFRGLWKVDVGTLRVGLYDNETDAARAYNAKVVELYGKQAELNDIPWVSPAEARSMPTPNDKRVFATSQHRGVTQLRNGLWRARIQINGKTILLGDAHSEEEAREMYDNACKQHGLMDRINA